MNKKEKELFLELCSFQEPNEKRIRVLLEEGAATPELLGHLFFNRVAGIAYGVLEQTELLNCVNREFRNSLMGSWHLNERFLADYIGCLKYLSLQLNACEVPYALLKGAYLCGKYPVGYRASNDIDVLIDPKDVGRASAKLKLAGFKQGYLQNGKFVEATRQQVIESKMMRGETVPFIKEIKLPYIKFLEVDLNFSLDYKNGDGQALRAMLRNTQSVTVGNATIRTLSSIDFFLHLCAHLYKEATTISWVQMKRDMTFYKFCDLYMLLYEMSEEQCLALISVARERELFKEFLYCMNAILCFFGHQKRIRDCVLFIYGNIGTMPSDFSCVSAPAENKRYRYRETDIVKRFFAKDRMKLLEEEPK